MQFQPVGYTSPVMSTSGIERLNALPQRPYLPGPSPLQRMERLSELLGGPDLLIKRDDTLPLALGGNKVRKLTYVVADALDQGADTLITTGAIQSNHCLLTLAAANREGLACRLVLEERVPGTYNPEASGNNFLYRLLGAERIDVVERGGSADAMRRAEAAARAEGRTPYLIPGGASNPLGSCGYASCAVELLDQIEEMGLTANRIVCASGSGGTHAGLVAGLIAAGSDVEVTGINVSRQRAEQEPHVAALTEAILAFLGVDAAAAARSRDLPGRVARPRLLPALRGHAGGGHHRCPDTRHRPGPGVHGQGDGRPDRHDPRRGAAGRSDRGVPAHRRHLRPVRQSRHVHFGPRRRRS